MKIQTNYMLNYATTKTAIKPSFKSEYEYSFKDEINDVLDTFIYHKQKELPKFPINGLINSKNDLDKTIDAYNQLFPNKELISNKKSIINGVKSQSQAAYKKQILKAIVNHKTLNKNASLNNNLYQIINDTDSLEKFQTRDLILKQYTQHESKDTFKNNLFAKIANKFSKQKVNPNQYRGPIIASMLGDLLLNTNSIEEAYAKMDLLDSIADENILMNNKSLTSKLPKIIQNTKNKKQSYAKLLVLDNFMSNENIINNQNISNKLGELVSSTVSPQIANAKNDIINKYISSKYLYENQSLNKNIDYIIKLQSTAPRDGILKIMNTFASGKYEHTTLPQILGDMIRKTNSLKESDIETKLADKIAKNKMLYENENIKNNLKEIITNTRTEDKLKAKLTIIDTVMNNTLLRNNTNIIDQLGNIIRNCNSKFASLVQSEYLIQYATNPKLHNNKDISKNLCKRLSELSSTHKFIKNTLFKTKI